MFSGEKHSQTHFCVCACVCVLCSAAEVERDLIPLAQHAPQKFGDKLKTLVQLIGVFCRLLRSSIKVYISLALTLPHCCGLVVVSWYRGWLRFLRSLYGAIGMNINRVMLAIDLILAMLIPGQRDCQSTVVLSAPSRNKYNYVCEYTTYIPLWYIAPRSLPLVAPSCRGSTETRPSTRTPS